MKYKDFLIALLIFLTGFVLVPQAYIFPVIFVIGFISMLGKFNKGFQSHDYLILFTLFFSTIIFIVGYSYADTADSVSVFSKYVPYTFLIAGTFYFSDLINYRILRFLFFLLMMEVLVGIMEYSLGIPYLFAPAAENGETTYGSTDLLYFNRVYGLSGSVSVFAQKVLIAFLLLFYLKFNSKVFKILLVIICVGFLVSFNRTAIISAIVFLIYYYGRRLNFKTFIWYLIISVPLISSLFIYWDVVENQFFRGKGDVDYSGRDFIFEYYVNFIQANPFFGNLIQKLWYRPNSSELFHAHNSYLETIASLGLFVSSFLFLFVILLIKKNKSFTFVLPLLVYSLFQYGFFWGVSFLDIIFFTFLINKAANISEHHSLFEKNSSFFSNSNQLKSKTY